MRQTVTTLTANNFGFSVRKLEKRLKRDLGLEGVDDPPPEVLELYNERLEQSKKFAAWFIKDEREAVIHCLREITGSVYQANSIYPTTPEELHERRMLQQKAIGNCFWLMQELQYAIETLEVDINKYTPFGLLIKDEIKLLLKWKKSDKKFKINNSGNKSDATNLQNDGDEAVQVAEDQIKIK